MQQVTGRAPAKEGTPGVNRQCFIMHALADYSSPRSTECTKRGRTDRCGRNLRGRRRRVFVSRRRGLVFSQWQGRATRRHLLRGLRSGVLVTGNAWKSLPRAAGEAEEVDSESAAGRGAGAPGGEELPLHGELGGGPGKGTNAVPSTR